MSISPPNVIDVVLAEGYDGVSLGYWIEDESIKTPTALAARTKPDRAPVRAPDPFATQGISIPSGGTNYTMWGSKIVNMEREFQDAGFQGIEVRLTR